MYNPQFQSFNTTHVPPEHKARNYLLSTARCNTQRTIFTTLRNAIWNKLGRALSTLLQHFLRVTAKLPAIRWCQSWQFRDQYSGTQIFLGSVLILVTRITQSGRNCAVVVESNSFPILLLCWLDSCWHRWCKARVKLLACLNQNPVWYNTPRGTSSQYCSTLELFVYLLRTISDEAEQA